MTTDLRLTLHSSDFVISAGSVPFKVEEGRPLSICLLHRLDKDEWVLPKGRKDAGESLEQAAVRETYEETGYDCILFPLTFPTRAPASGTPLGNVARVATDCTEPIAINLRRAGAATKITCWFVTRLKNEGATKTEGTQMDDEIFESMFLPFNEALDKLSYDDDREVAAKAASLVSATQPGS